MAGDSSGVGEANGKDIPPKSKTAPSKMKEEPPAGLLTIGMKSGIHADEILKSPTTFCQTHDTERIVESLTTDVFEKTATMALDNDRLKKKRQADFRDEKSCQRPERQH